jgi:uncharacterized protein YjiK
MLRLLLLVGVLVVLTALTGSALGDLAIVQQWPVDTFPGGICYDSDRDHIWLVNNSTAQVREYTRTGAYIGMFPAGQVGLNWPIGMDFCTATNNLWIGDEFSPEQVVECTRAGAQVSSFSVLGSMQDVSGLAYNPNDDHIFLADDNASEVVEWTSTGGYVGRWSSLPCVDSDSICYLSTENTLLVGDDTAGMVCKFSVVGVLIETYDMALLLGITGVESLAFDAAAGTVFLGDSDTNIVYEISGFAGQTLVDDATWGSIKAMFR